MEDYGRLLKTLERDFVFNRDVDRRFIALSASPPKMSASRTICRSTLYADGQHYGWNCGESPRTNSLQNLASAKAQINGQGSPFFKMWHILLGRRFSSNLRLQLVANAYILKSKFSGATILFYLRTNKKVHLGSFLLFNFFTRKS